MFSSSRQLGHQNSPEIIHDRLPGQTAFVDRQPWQTVQSQERGVQTSGLPSLELVSPPTAHLRTNQQKRLFAYPTQNQRVEFYGVSERQEFLDDF